MKFTVAAILATAASAMDLRAKFMQYLANHGKSYITVEEFSARLDLFANIEERINYHNNGDFSYTVAHNKFSDMSEDEKAQFRGKMPAPPMAKFGVKTLLDTSNNAATKDWRTEGAVNPIQDQGQCGSCWAFGSCASLEGAHFVASGELLKFAEQSLVDCAKFKWGNFGCGGGLETNAFNYWETNYAILEADYPYTASNGDCQYDNVPHTDVLTSGWTDVTPGSSSQLVAAINQSVVSVGIEADQFVFQMYSSGIFNDSRCGTSIDHAVNLVGYGNENGQDYYILRNSWGTGWGEQGYMKIANNGDGDGVCAVQNDAHYPASN